jgi:hypothetical protein
MTGILKWFDIRIITLVVILVVLFVAIIIDATNNK